MISNLDKIFSGGNSVAAGGTPEGFDALVIAAMAERQPVLHVCRDDSRMSALTEALGFFAPNLEIVGFPAWDCLPYDRISPNPAIAARRLDCLMRLALGLRPDVLITTVNAILQRLPPRTGFHDALFMAEPGETVPLERLQTFLEMNGYHRASTVREHGEYALRGGIVDLFPPGSEDAIRLDFFGDEIESLRRFDPVSQRTIGPAERLTFGPVSEFTLNETTIARFRKEYRVLFGARATEDPVFEAVSAGVRHSGVEQWLPLMHDRLETVFDYAPENAVIGLDYQVPEIVTIRCETIEDHYEARQEILAGAYGTDTSQFCRPLPPAMLHLDEGEWQQHTKTRRLIQFGPFAAEENPEKSPQNTQAIDSLDFGGRRPPGLAEARQRQDANPFDEARKRFTESDRIAVLFARNPESAKRLAGLLREHGMEGAEVVESWAAAQKRRPPAISVVVLEIEQGFVFDACYALSEQDILGERRPSSARGRRKAEQVISEASSLAEGSLVVHLDHGIGRYRELETLEIDNLVHDCLVIEYADEDRLSVPVENIELLSRFGSEEALARLDKLGASGWQARKARARERIREIAENLLRTAAERAVSSRPEIHPPSGGEFAEFSAGFAWTETDDQLQSIEDVAEDLAQGRPMDRLICGDVGFGKTEIALRAAYLVAMDGYQVAVVVPTTLLARQHFNLFAERFRRTPFEVGQLSRMVSSGEAKVVRQKIASGDVQIVIGTHALLSKAVSFANLGLLVIDEEQHFGVVQKECLKQMRADVHILTLTATPIPRTLQMALTGVRDMSIIATPPVDRLAVRTFVAPYDPVAIKDAILREQARGGQTFYVCPRISDLPHIRRRLERLVPDIRIRIAHGQMSIDELEETMSGFIDKKYDILLCTHIVEAGLDIPAANTIIVHRADRFGLAQLYQLRGRVGRSKVRAYAYLTLPPGQKLSESATRRLEVMQSLDTLGAGFTLASHDLDIRGAGNLLGDEQSGHVKEVGVELYQHMLKEAVSELRVASQTAALRGAQGAKGAFGEDPFSEWVPRVSLDMSIQIPGDYVADLSVRLGLYRRASLLVGQAEIDGFAEELADRFGPVPDEVRNLLGVVALKHLCRRANIERLDSGSGGTVLIFRNNAPPDPQRVLDFVTENTDVARILPGQKLHLQKDWPATRDRLTGMRRLIEEIAGITEEMGMGEMSGMQDALGAGEVSGIRQDSGAAGL